ncbi:unnamed protein product [Closterium sp. NIES-54]
MLSTSHLYPPLANYSCFLAEPPPKPHLGPPSELPPEPPQPAPKPPLQPFQKPPAPPQPPTALPEPSSEPHSMPWRMHSQQHQSLTWHNPPRHHPESLALSPRQLESALSTA